MALSYAAIAKGHANLQTKPEPPADKHVAPVLQQLPSTAVAPAPVSTPVQPNQPVPATRQSGSYTLHFGDLRPDVTTQFLTSILKEVGNIDSIKVCRDRISRQSLGYAYVNFQNKADADRCIEKLNYMTILGAPVRITRILRDRDAFKSQKGNVFIKGLCKTIDVRTLHHTFSQFGPVHSCKIRENESGQTNIAFVQFEQPEDAQRAINEVNGKFLDGVQVALQFFVPRSARDSPDPDKTYVNLYVKPLSKSLTEEEFKAYFSTFGEITSYKLKMRENSNECAGFGFVSFKEHSMAKAAVDASNGKVVPGLSLENSPLYVARMQTKVERTRAIDAKYKKLLQDRAQYMNLYVKNLGNEVDDSKLHEVFGEFGEIHSATVQKDESGNSKGFGYVCFVSPEAASKAIEKLDKSEGILGQKPLFINRWQSKEQRQSQQFDPMNGAVSGAINQHMLMGGWGPSAPFMAPWAWSGGRNMMPLFPPGGRGAMMFNPQYMHGGRGAHGWGATPWPQQHGGRGGGMNMFGAGAGRPGAVSGAAYQQTHQRQQPGHAPMQPASQQPDLVRELLKLDEVSRRQSLGELLHPLVEDAVRILGRDPTTADKVTGMLIDLEVDEVVSLVMDAAKLQEKVGEAINLLEAPSAEQ